MVVNKFEEEQTMSSTVDDDEGEEESNAKVNGKKDSKLRQHHHHHHSTDDDDDDVAGGAKSSAGGESVPFPKCVCNWKNCRAYQKAFRAASTSGSQDKPHVLHGVVRIKLYKNQSDCEAYRQCLDRTLGVTKEPDWKIEKKSNEEYCKYTIARHHFTELHMIKYDSLDPKHFSFVKPFSSHGAKKYLYKVDPDEVLKREDGAENEVVSYFQCPNVPSDVVKLEYRRIVESIKVHQEQKQKAEQKTKTKTESKRNSKSRQVEDDDEEDDDELEEERPIVTNTSKSKNKNHSQIDDNKSVASSQAAEQMVKLKEVENKLLKEQLDAMKSQLAFLHDMVEKLQAQHFDNASVYSRGSRKSQASGQRKGTSRKISSSSSQQPRSKSGKKISNRHHDDEEDEADSAKLHEDDDDDDDDDEDYDDDDASDVKSQKTFQSKFKMRPQQQHDDDDDDEEDESDDDDDDSGEYDDYTECMSLGASTILSVSRSVKSLPREMELEKDDGETDDDGDGYNGANRLHQSPCNSSHNSITLTRPSKGQQQQQSRIRKMSIVKKQNSGTSSTASNTISYDSRPKSRVLGSATVNSRSSVASSSVGGEDESGYYEVTSLAVTDPYGEKGTYSGSISKATGMPDGYGRLEYDEAGRWYEGDWKQGRWTGHGRLSNGDGDYYEGGVKNDQKHGRGYMRFSDGRTFEGHYKDGQMVDGKMTYEDGSTYDGSWVDGMRHGFGQCTFADCSIYRGEFKEGEFCGYGKMTWNDGGWYEGQWLNGDMHGKGREVRPDGTLRHDGDWWRGQPVRR